MYIANTITIAIRAELLEFMSSLYINILSY